MLEKIEIADKSLDEVEIEVFKLIIEHAYGVYPLYTE